MKWNKSDVDACEVRNICAKYGVDAITAAIMVRRGVGVDDGHDVWPILEDSTGYLHNPFLFDAMEDAVERILDSANSDGGGDEGVVKEKVLVYGDRDVDGVAATIIMTGALRDAGCDVSYRVPQGDEPYGLTVQAVEDFADEVAASGANSALIVTVDCGISCCAAVEKAAEAGIDVIVTDHHNIPDKLPDATAILDPKMAGCGYPFDGLSGAGVALKVAAALRFATSPYYKMDIALLDASVDEETGTITIEGLKTRNMVITARLNETLQLTAPSVHSRLLPFLTGQHIYVWDVQRVQDVLAMVFGGGVEFALMSLRDEVGRKWKGFAHKSLQDVKAASRKTLYSGNNSTVDALYSVFCAWLQANTATTGNRESDDMCLAALAALADIMPMTDENKIIEKVAMKAIHAGNVRHGISELMARQALIPQAASYRDLAWVIIPALNAAGRMGEPLKALELLASEDGSVRELLAQEIVRLNDERKRLVGQAMLDVSLMAKKALTEYDGKIIVVINGNVAKGVTGLVASRLAEKYAVPVVIGTVANNIVTGSVRAAKGFSCTGMLNTMKDLFINFGGHNSAAGFSMEKAHVAEFRNKVLEYVHNIKVATGEQAINVDAEIPPSYVNAGLLKVVDFFAPFGTGNNELIFMTQGVTVCNAAIVGRSETQHLKLTLDCGKVKCPAMLWNGGELFGSEIKIGDTIDVLYTASHNCWGGVDTMQMVIKEWRHH